MMKELYKEMQERLSYLQAETQTEEIQIRIKELSLSIVRVQQSLLQEIKNVEDVHITPELLKNIYARVEQVYIAEINDVPDVISLMNTGEFLCIYDRDDYYGNRSKIITCEKLTADLDVLIAERLHQEEIAKQTRLACEKSNQLKLIQREKAARLAKYEELKKEFEI